MKKFLSAILVIAMLLTTISFTAVAESNVAKIGDTEYATLSEALNSAKTMTGDVVITLLGDVDLSTYESTDMRNSTFNTLTIDGAKKIITNLAQPLVYDLAKDVTLKDITFKDVNITTSNLSNGMTGSGVLTAGTCGGQDVTINNAIVDGGTIISNDTGSGDWAGGFVGYFQGDGTEKLTISDSAVKNVTIKSNNGGAIGSLVGQVNNSTAVVTNTTISNNTLQAIENGAYREEKTGIAIGTNIGSQISLGIIVEEPSKIEENMIIEKVLGRMLDADKLVAKLEITKGEYLYSPIKTSTDNKDSLTEIYTTQTTANVIVAEGFELGENEDGSFTVVDLSERFLVVTTNIPKNILTDKYEVKAGDEFAVTVTYEGAVDLMNARWTLNFDPAYFECTTNTATEDGKIEDAYYSSEAFKNGTELGTYVFIAKDHTNAKDCEFFITDALTSYNNEYHDETSLATAGKSATVSFILKSYEIEFLVDGEKQVDDEATEDVNEAEELEINFDGKPHKVEAVVTPEASKVEYFVEGEEEARLNPPTFTEKGTHKVTCKVTPASGTGYAETEKVFTLTIIEPKFVVEVNTNADEDYVAGKKLVLVYTNVKDCSFKYGDNYMVDVTERGYWYKDWEDVDSKEEIKYDYVYAIVVDAIENGKVADYETKVTDEVLSTDVMMVEAYDSDINISGTTNINDISTIYSVYNTYEVSFANYNYMTHVLKADTNGDKVVDGYDTHTVVNAVYPLN